MCYYCKDALAEGKTIYEKSTRQLMDEGFAFPRIPSVAEVQAILDKEEGEEE